ncbi:MAG: efflux transporter outer membrane subunit [Candidatus Pseudomonas phytovorans]|uniref:Efflux transporter outer membrane subunit n=1 Tax=Candidatus Pseudomonas phytovorans TaxID=3121377 RepID=A0AAJ5WHH8_9PSED|nr:efflux transporter outer membrane subunit [Pseudomonas sp.]WEK28845.1 MAG: efflux transporter outer membrane subunit [Pseudomonas sp.]
MKNKPMNCALGALLLTVSGCSLIPHYDRPPAPVAHAYSVPSEAGSPSVTWQQLLRSESLQALIKEALANNLDYRVAALNIERAQALYRIERADLLPSINATGAGASQRLPRDLSATERTETTHNYSAGLGFTAYELDFFGRVRSLNQQALETYFATVEAKRSAKLSLVAQVAAAYFQLQADQQLLAVAQRTLDSQQQSYALVASSYEQEVATELDLSQALSTVKTAESAKARYQRLVEQDKNALVLLVGKPLPETAFTAISADAFTLKDDLPAGMPSELLTLRPDILAAEHQLKAANGNIGAARAAFFPSIRLTASAGSASAQLGDLFAGGQGAWSFVPTITLPIFDYGRNKANLDVAKVQATIEVANYQKAIQTAFREVSDALVAKAYLDAQVLAEYQRVQANGKSYALADSRYREGVDTYLNTLDAQRNLFSAEQDLITVKLASITNLISLYKALGGGEAEVPMSL